MSRAVDPRGSTSNGGGEDQEQDDDQVREIHALTPSRPPPPPSQSRRSDFWETGSDHSINSGENFATMSGEFHALVLAGSMIAGNANRENEGVNYTGNNNNLARIGEDDHDVPYQETNPLAIVPDSSPLEGLPSSPRITSGSSSANCGISEDVSLERVKQEEIESKISAWQTAKIAKVNNKFKREDSIINGCETEQVQKAQSAFKKVERKLEEKREKTLEKMRNNIAKAHRKAEEKRASAIAKRGTKVAKTHELANMMRAVGKVPTRHSFF
ncbi:hypothetical protein NE237_005320 [Protea cynaroides]|uniref:Remorin C-terminal domain-containing protein n=1 Tax=Protea cynaroides TaxID=273540 RepID=A0A9Q0KKK9_9MAGN|nr:hypothetical protein NE237_005320 [Protea cynaroides]